LAQPPRRVEAQNFVTQAGSLLFRRMAFGKDASPHLSRATGQTGMEHAIAGGDGDIFLKVS